MDLQNRTEKVLKGLSPRSPPTMRQRALPHRTEYLPPTLKASTERDRHSESLRTGSRSQPQLLWALAPPSSKTISISQDFCDVANEHIHMKMLEHNFPKCISWLIVHQEKKKKREGDLQSEKLRKCQVLHPPLKRSQGMLVLSKALRSPVVDKWS